MSDRSAREGNDAALVDVRAQRIAAGVFGILLGALGAHKFVLGRYVPGSIMLFMSLATLGRLAPVVALVGAIEGVIYLLTPSSEFRRVYIDGDRRWF